MSMTIMKDAGDRLDRIAKEIKQSEGVKDYAKALKLAGERNPELLKRYLTGNASTVNKYALSPIEHHMVLLQNDPARVRFLAGSVMDHQARFDGAGKPITQLSPEIYIERMKQLRKDNPTLGAAAETGFIASDDYWLLAILIPAVAGEVERVHGVKPMVVGYQARNAEVRRYSSDHVKYDGNGNQYRVYSSMLDEDFRFPRAGALFPRRPSTALRAPPNRLNLWRRS